MDGYPGRFVCLVRRKGNDWFVAGINAAEPRRTDVPLDFLEPGTYGVKLYKDNINGDALIVEDKMIDIAKGLTTSMPSSGGLAFKVSR
ncbi:MAG: glycoside hydrolase family 97 C-terminal domain-containing protein [Planctomycetota bacterium]